MDRETVTDADAGTIIKRGRRKGTKDANQRKARTRQPESVAPELLQPVNANTVNVDPIALAAEAETVAAEATAEATATAAELPPTPEAQAATVQVENAAEGYKMIALAVVAQGSELWCPAWNITQTEKTDLADAIVQALLLWFPDGVMPPKYMALLVIAGVGVKIAAARYDDNTGLPPRHVQLRSAEPAQPAAEGNGTEGLGRHFTH